MTGWSESARPGASPLPAPPRSEGEAAEQAAVAQAEDGPPTFVDMAPLVDRLEGWLAPRAAELTQVDLGPFDRRAFVERTGFTRRGQGAPEVLVGREVGLELGHPQTRSSCFALLTADPQQVQANRVRWLGPDLPELARAARHPIAQIVLLQVRSGAALDPFDLDGAQYLIHRLPGYVVRSVPGRLWVRLGRRALDARLDLQTVGQALLCALVDDFDAVEAAEVLFVTSSAADVDALTPIATEARILAGQHQKLALSPDGEVVCEDLDCEQCDERPVCDSLRDVIIKRRRQRQDPGRGSGGGS